MKILFLANLIPYPLDGGGKIFTYSLLEAMSKENEVHLCCFYEHENIGEGRLKLEPLCKSISIFPIRVTTRENMGLMMFKAAKSIFSKNPLATSKYETNDMKKEIINMLREYEFDYVVYNILAMCSYDKIIKKYCPNMKTIFFEQNCETLIYKRHLAQSNNIFKKIFVSLEVKKLYRFEQKMINEVDKLVLLSKEDKNALLLEDTKGYVIPIAVKEPNYVKQYRAITNRPIRLLFIGTMTWEPNNEGMIWFLKNVMPSLSDVNNYEVTIIGKNPSEEVKELCDKYSNVNLLGYVKLLDTYYDKCDALIVPLFVGSGQRVKIIEAIARGMVVISTEIGAEGLELTDGESVLIANSKLEFVEKINKCKDLSFMKNVGEKCRDIYINKYSTQVLYQQINDLLR